MKSRAVRRKFSQGRKHSTFQGRMIEALESRLMLDGSPFETAVITPTGGTPTVIAGPGGLDGTPQLDLNNDNVGDYIVRYSFGGAVEVSAILSDGTSPDTGSYRWKEYRIAHNIGGVTVANVTVGDINNDGQADVVIHARATSSDSSARSIDIYLGHENGTFTTGQNISIGVLPRGFNLSIFDANGDGKNDLVQQTDGKFTVYKGNGDGTVATPGIVSQIPISQSNGLDISKDLTGDGIPDIAISGTSNDGFASAFIGVYKGSTAGTYTSTNLPIPPGFGSFTVLQFLKLENLDANPAFDIIALGSTSPLPGSPTTLFVFRNNGTGTFTQSFSSGSFANGLYTPLNSDASQLLPFVTGDIDNDGDTDIALMEGNLLSSNITVRIERNNGSAGFSESQAIPVTTFPNTSRILLVDMDNDGFDDLVVHHDKSTGGKVTTVYFSQGNGTFAAGLDVDHGLNSDTNARIADFNNDGKQDLQFRTFADGLSGFSLTVMLNQGKTFAAPMTTNLANVAVPQEGGGSPSTFPVFPVRDYDGDNVPDVIGNSSGSGSGEGRPLGLTVIKGATDGSFTFLEPTLIYNVNANGTGASIVGDFNLDGKPDLLLGTGGTGSVGVTVAINGAPLPPDTAGTNHNSARLLGPLTDRLTVIEHVNADANADPRDRFDWYRFSVDSDVTVRSAAIPLVAGVVIRTARLDGIGTGNDFPTGLEPVFIDKALTAGSWHTSADKSSNSETDYRLDIFIPAAGADIGVYEGLEQRTSGVGTLDFGTLIKNTTDTRRKFLVRNDGLATLNLSAIQFPAGFSIADNSLVATLAPGASDVFSIEFDTGTAGEFSGDIIIPSNDADTPSFVIPVMGAVEDTPEPPTNPLMTVKVGQTTLTSGQLVNFGTPTKDSTPPEVLFTVSNSGGTPLTLSNLQVPNGYTLVEPLSSSIAAGGSDTFTVRLNTGTVGTIAGSMTFTNNSGGTNSTFSIALQGNVLPAVVGPPDLEPFIDAVTLNGKAITSDTPLVPGDKITVTLALANVSENDLTATQDVLVNLFLSGDGSATGSPVPVTFKKPKIKGNLSISQKAQLVIPSTVTAGNLFVRAESDVNGVIAEADEDNNFKVSNALPVEIAAGQVGTRTNVTLNLTDTDGTPWALTAKGGAKVTVTPVEIEVEGGEPISAYDLNITNGGNGDISITTKTVRGSADDGKVTLQNVTVVGTTAPLQALSASSLSAAAAVAGAPLAKFLAKTTRLIGTLEAPEGLKALTLDSANGATVIIGPSTDPKATTTLTLNLIEDMSINSQMPIKSFTALEWIDSRDDDNDLDDPADSLSAPTIGSISIKGSKPFLLDGDFQADVTVNVNAAPGTKPTLGAVKIAGDLIGSAWDIAGSMAGITVGKDTNGLTVATHSGGVKTSSFKSVTNATFDIDGDAGAITALNWLAGTIEAKSAKSISIKGAKDVLGDMRAGVNILGDPTNTKLKTALGSLSVANVLKDATIRVAGNSGAMTVGAVENVNVYVGVKSGVVGAPESVDDFDEFSLAGFTVKGIKDPANPQNPNLLNPFINTLIAAKTITKAALKDVDTTNNATAFGLIADKIGAYSRSTGNISVKLSKLDDPAILTPLPGEADHVDDYLIRVL